MNNTFKNYILLILTIFSIVFLFFLGPIPQNPNYHHFADAQNIFGVPNFFNVISNLPFIIIGIWGLTRVWFGTVVPSIKQHAMIFCVSVFLIGLGSIYYHLDPDNPSLVWDRLPMTIAFMSFFSALIAEYVHRIIGQRLLYPLLLLGISSVIYWHITESMGEGDLRPYAAVQYIPLALTPLLLIMYKPRNTYKRYVVLSLVFYGLAKMAEIFDANIFAVFKIAISGHMIKHLLAAAGAVCILKMFLTPNIQTKDN